MSDVREQPVSTLTEGPSPQSGNFIWYELLTPDPDGAKAFYDAVVGWNVEGRSNLPNGYRTIGRSDGKMAGGLLPLNHEMQQHGARAGWLAYVSVADVDATVASVERAGGKILMEPFDIPQVGRVSLISDPQGAALYVMKPIPPESDPNGVSDVFSPSAEQRVGWNELQTSDVEVSRAFYRDQFGWGSDEFMDMGEMGKYRFFDHQGTRLGALFDPANGQPPHWRFYIRVPSIGQAKGVTEAKGGTIHMGPHQVPTGDWILVASDPQGAEFALVGGQ